MVVGAFSSTQINSENELLDHSLRAVIDGVSVTFQQSDDELYFVHKLNKQIKEMQLKIESLEKELKPENELECDKESESENSDLQDDEDVENNG